MHNLFGERAAYRGGPAWHNLGKVFDQPMSATEALQLADIDYGVVTAPLFYTSPSDGMEVPTGQVAIIRPAWKGEPEAVLGFATREYRPLQNNELARLIDPLTGDWPVETIGALGKGERMFLTLDAGTTEIGGDEIRQYLFCYNGHDGATALKIMITPVRVVCQNTCITGMQQASVTADVAHTRRILAEATLAIDLVSQIRKAQDFTLAELTRLTEIRIGGSPSERADTLMSVLKAIYPDPTTPAKLSQLSAHDAGRVYLSDERIAELLDTKLAFEQARIRAAENRKVALERIFAFFGDRPAYAWTAWAVYNGITEMESWKEGGNSQTFAKSVMVGPRAATMARAYGELVKLA